MISRTASAVGLQRGVTIIEVLASVVLILVGFCGIFAMNTRSLLILRKTRQVVASSQLLQERIETLRSHAWPEISNAHALAVLLQTPAESGQDLADANPVETVTVTVPNLPAGATATDYTFTVRRQRGAVRIIHDGDLGTQPLLLVQNSVTWRDMHGAEQRTLRTIIGQVGLTRSGIFGSAFGRPAQGNSTVATNQ
jgi:Tfp pilus assembly protein PilV